MIDFDITLDDIKHTLRNLLIVSGHQHLIERLKYINTTNPPKMFKQIGVSRGDAFRIMYRESEIPITITNKELVNYVDFDGWKSVFELPQLKGKYNLSYEVEKDVPIYQKLYFAKHHDWLSRKTTITHSKNPAMSIAVNNHDIALCIISNRIRLNCRHPTHVIDMNRDEFDSYVENKYHAELQYNNDNKVNHPYFINNHCFTNIHVIKTVGMMKYIGNKLKHCAKEQSKIKQFFSCGCIFVHITTDNPDVKEYTVQYTYDKSGNVIIDDYARVCNLAFPKGFDFIDMYNFKWYLEKRINTEYFMEFENESN